MGDYFKKKDFMVKWRDNKGKIHETKINGRFISAMEAANYIYNTRSTCSNYPEAWWI